MPFATLPSKPDAPLSYNLIASPQPNGQVVVFINGLGLPAMSWTKSITLLQQVQDVVQPTYLTYDRFGQGLTTCRDPLNLKAEDPAYGHDINASVRDLQELIQVVLLKETKNLIFVAASIGVHIARLYAHQHPGTVRGLILLDSNIANAEYTELMPAPGSPEYEPSDDYTEETYAVAYTKLGKMFNSDAKNGEALDRRNVKLLLPDPATPKLRGPDGKAPWLVVVGHDPQRFEDEGWERIQVPRSINRRYLQPKWHEYNEGLLGLSEPERTTGVLLAPGCGHFIQVDNPQFVADQITVLLQKIKSQV